MSLPVVLFVCVHNSGRSLAVRVSLDHYAQGLLRVESAGSDPAAELNPSVVALLEALRLDVSREFPQPVTDEHARSADVVVTMACGDACPDIRAPATSTGNSRTLRGSQSTRLDRFSTRSTHECAACCTNCAMTRESQRRTLGRLMP